jgi:glycosyltransferase involved in cell wall biosynthesis
MAQGTPVIALDAPGVTEALRDVAVLVPDDVAALGAAMRRFSSDDARADIGEAGKAFASGFTWERAARLFADVLDDLAR